MGIMRIDLIDWYGNNFLFYVLFGSKICVSFTLHISHPYIPRLYLCYWWRKFIFFHAFTPQMHFPRKEWCFPLYREVICLKLGIELIVIITNHLQNYFQFNLFSIFKLLVESISVYKCCWIYLTYFNINMASIRSWNTL